jgi:hypothetical protein
VTKVIRVDLSWVSVDHDVWNFEIMKGVVERIIKIFFPAGGCKIISINFMKCIVDYEVPGDFQNNRISDYDYHVRVDDIKD